MSHFVGKPAEAFDFHEILYDKGDWIATITFNRPEAYNAYTTSMLEEIITALKDASWDDSVAVLILTGAGDKAFSTGGDVKEYQHEFLRRPRDYWKWMGLFQESLDLLRNLGKPAIARLNGMVAGGGNEFNLACDLAVCADHVTIRQVGVRVGSVACGGATQWLPITIGDRRAREMLFTCDPVDAQTALQWGLVNRVVPYAELDTAVSELAGKLIDKFPEAIRYTKQQVNFWKDLAWYQTIGHARDWLSLHYTAVEPWEGMTAFVEKRAPDHLGVRKRAADNGSSEFVWGPYIGECVACGAKGIPEQFKFCGQCGAPLTREPARR